MILVGLLEYSLSYNIGYCLKLVKRNTIYKNNNTTPSLQQILSPLKEYHRNRLPIRLNIATFVKAPMLITNFVEIREIPKISVMLRNPLPTIFPKARFKLSFFVASMLVASSGILVPNATIVAPITTLGIPRPRAIVVADWTIK
jgi:hypothetical protein